MKVQRIHIPEKDRIAWLVIPDDYLPVRPIQQYLTRVSGHSDLCSSRMELEVIFTLRRNILPLHS
jgi:hypothetical protein